MVSLMSGSSRLLMRLRRQTTSGRSLSSPTEVTGTAPASTGSLQRLVESTQGSEPAAIPSTNNQEDVEEDASTASIHSATSGHLPSTPAGSVASETASSTGHSCGCHHHHSHDDLDQAQREEHGHHRDAGIDPDEEERRLANEEESLDAKIEMRRSVLDSKTSASGMSQQDLRATIRDVQMDSNLSATEKSKKIQEIMSFSWKQSQSDMVRPKRASSTASMRSRRGSDPGARSLGPVVRTALEQASSQNSSGTTASLHRRSSSSARNNSGPSSEVDRALAGVDYVSVEDDDDDEEGCCSGRSQALDESMSDGGNSYSAEALPVITYHDEEKRVMGCEHYERKCHISAPCCDEFFGCRFCHDEACDHQIDRYAINRTRCMGCGHVQGVHQKCENCSLEFARYHCAECKFFDDKEGKKIYHCDKCRICRIGEGLGADYFHCDRCNACMSITLRDHKCVERSLESDCPVCSEYLFTSTTPVMFLVCGHCIHVKCYETYIQTNFTCPLCCKSLGDMSHYFNRIDQMLAFERMPEEYRGLRSRIFCSDCEERSIAPFHFVYHKCRGCGSYNTKVLEQLGPETSDSPK